MKSVLGDTGPLYALADPSDQYHSRAAKELEILRERSLSVSVSVATLSEAQTLVMRRLGVEYGRQWLAEIFKGTALVQPDTSDFLLAAELLDRYPDQQITLVDAVTVVLSRRIKIPVWTFDRHFITMRAAVWRG